MPDRQCLHARLIFERTAEVGQFNLHPQKEQVDRQPALCFRSYGLVRSAECGIDNNLNSTFKTQNFLGLSKHTRRRCYTRP